MIIREGERGEAQPIIIKQGQANMTICFAVAADTTITFKPKNDFCTTTLTVACCDFAICTCCSTVTWTPTAAQLTTLGVGDKAGFVNLNNDACTRTAVARFCLTIEDV